MIEVDYYSWNIVLISEVHLDKCVCVAFLRFSLGSPPPVPTLLCCLKAGTLEQIS